MSKQKEIIYKAISVDERLPENYATIHFILIDSRLPMIAQWRPCDGSVKGNGIGQWWSMGLSKGKHIEQNNKCVTHWLELQI